MLFSHMILQFFSVRDEEGGWRGQRHHADLHPPGGGEYIQAEGRPWRFPPPKVSPCEHLSWAEVHIYFHIWTPSSTWLGQGNGGILERKYENAGECRSSSEIFKEILKGLYSEIYLELAPWCVLGNPYGAIETIAPYGYLTKELQIQVRILVRVRVLCPCPCSCLCPCSFPCPRQY